nr:hypothetical protein [Radiobacillus kanasensis]
MQVYKQLDDPKLKHYVLKRKADVFHAMKTFFHKQEENIALS